MRIVFELPYYSKISGGIRETLKLSQKMNAMVRFQRLDGVYPDISNTWTVGLPDATLPACDVCITYSDTPHMQRLVRLPQPRKIALMMLSYGMSIETERKNVTQDNITVMCSTKKLEKMISAEGVKVNRVGFAVDTLDMYDENKPRKNYLAIMYNPMPLKNYRVAVEVADSLFKRNIIDGVITFGTDQNYRHAKHPIGLVKHYTNANRDEVREIFNTCKCFLMPSVSEGLNLTPIEATMCGCPSVLVDGAIDEIYFNGQNSFVVPNADINKLTEKAWDCVLNFDKYSEPFKQHMSETVKPFTWDKVINNIKALL